MQAAGLDNRERISCPENNKRAPILRMGTRLWSTD
jgi:hypothetical protein